MAVETYTNTALWKEYDASGLITVAANTLTVAGNNNTAFSIQRVFDVGYFGGDFEHIVAVKLNDDGAANNAVAPFWGVSNETSEAAHSFKQIDEASGDCLYTFIYEGKAASIYLREVVAGEIYQDYKGSLSIGSWYYHEIERDESTGTYGTLLCRIYSDESRTTLVDTLSVTLHEKEDFRTVYAASSYYANSNRPYSQEIKNLDLGLTYGTPEWYYRRLRGAA